MNRRGEEDLVPPLGGRACAPVPVQNQHVFGSFADNLDPPFGFSTFLQPTQGRVLNQVRCAAFQDPPLHLVTTDAIEVLRAAGDPIGPLSAEVIQTGDPLPPGARRLQNRSLLKVGVTLVRGTVQHRFFMDFNQQVEVHASSVAIDLFAPDNFEVTAMSPPFPAGLTRAGLVADELVGTSIIRIEQPTGLKDVIFTENIFVAQNTRAVLAVPPYAVGLTVYQASVGAAETAWEMHYGDPIVGSVEVGTIPFIPAARKTEPLIETPNVTHLRTGIDVDADRFFTLRWTIRP